MLEKILQEIKEMDCPFEAVPGDLVEAMAVANGFGMAKVMIMKIVQGHSSDGWIPCSERLPVVSEGTEDCCCPEFNVTIKDFDMATTLKCGSDGEWFDDNGYVYDVVAWRPLPEPYRPARKAVGEDYRQQIMDRFTRVE